MPLKALSPTPLYNPLKQVFGGRRNDPCDVPCMALLRQPEARAREALTTPLPREKNARFVRVS